MRGKPNILWICTDQQRFDTLGCYGNSFVKTPNIDGLADNGVLFEHCVVQSPICAPSRASMLTGRYPRTTGCRQNGQSIPAEERLVSRLLAGVGYVCGLSGKLHISACQPSVAPAVESRIDDGYAEFHWAHDADPRWTGSDYIHWLRDRGVGFERRPFRESAYVQVGMPAEHHHTTWCAEKAINFIEANSKQEQSKRPFEPRPRNLKGLGEEQSHPWMFSVNMFDPHHPFDPPEDYLERYLSKLDELPLPSYQVGELDNKPSFQKTDHHGAYNAPGYYPFSEMTAEDHRLVKAAYWAMIDLIDEQVGRILSALDRTGQRENTLIVFTSDHGEMLGDHGIYLKGPYFYEPAVRVPLIVSWPSVIGSGERSDALVELVDLAPTLMEAAGLPIYPGMQGRSFWPLLTGEADIQRHRDDAYCEFYNAMGWHQLRGNRPAYATMIRTKVHKLVTVHGESQDSHVEGELYDLASDPDERRNLWNNPEYLSLKCELLKRTCDRMVWTVDPLPERRSLF